MKRYYLLLAALHLAGSFAFAQTPNAEAVAQQYLRAWSFKDYPAMHNLSTSQTKSLLNAGAFATEAAALPPLTSDPKIVSQSNTADGTTVYFEAAGTPPVRGSVIIRSGTIEHPELLASANRSSTSATGPSVATSTGATVDGESVDSVLQKMTAASEKANTLRMAVAVKGSFMGQTVNDSGTLLYKKPDKFRMQLASFTMNADGKRSILFMPSSNIYMDMGALGTFELSPGIGSSAADMKSKYDVRLSGKREVNGQPAFELALKPPTSGMGGMGGMMGSGQMKLFVSPTSWFPIRAEMSGLTLDYSNVQVNAADITDQSFVFTPPANAQELSLGGLMGGMQ